MSVSVEVMRASDSAAMSKISSKELMRRAGESLAASIKKICIDNCFNKVTFFNGKGNNGGDGYVAAAILRQDGYKVKIYADEPQSDECKYYAKSFGVNGCNSIDTDGNYQIKPLADCFMNIKDFMTNTVLVDCLLGTGIKGDAIGIYAEIIKFINDISVRDRNYSANNNNQSQSRRTTFILSCDMPSGLKDNGRTNCAVIADKTLAIACDKDAYYLNDGKDYAGEIEVADIGISIIGESHILTGDALIEEAFPPRRQNTHKGSYGSVGIVACSENYAGAGKLSYIAAINTLGECALRSGAGLTRLYVPELMKRYMWNQVTACSIGDTRNVLQYGVDAFVYGVGDVIDAIANDSDEIKNDIGIYGTSELSYNVQSKKVNEIVYAYGMGVGDGDINILRQLIDSDSKLIIDADGLNLLSRNMDLLRDKDCNKIIILTPHVKEMSRLSGKTVEEILNDPINTAKHFAAEYGITLLLKGSGSVITDGNAVYINAKGSPCLAKGGSGDVLSGIIAALLAKGIQPLKAAATGAYILGHASEIAAARYGENSTLPQDIATAIKTIINR